MRTVQCSDRLREGVSARGGVFLEWGVYPGGVHPLWTEFLTHACENITFPKLRLQMVNI